MLSDPAVLCYRNSHAPVAALAWIVLLVYCVGFPAAVVVFVGRRMHALRDSVIVLPASPSSTLSHSSPAAQTTPRTASSASMGCWRTPRWQQQEKDNTIDEASIITADKLLSPFVAGDYSPSKYWFLAVDSSQFAVLAVIQAVCRNAAALAPVQLGGSVAVFTFAACMLWYHQPYARKARWKGYVRLYTYALCAVAACLNYATLTAAERRCSAACNICFVGSIVLIIVLVSHLHL
jgi:hypothetical protein